MPDKAAGAKPFGWTSAPPADGPDAKTTDLFADPDPTQDLDMGLKPQTYPRDSGSDSYEGIPGDGIVPG